MPRSIPNKTSRSIAAFETRVSVLDALTERGLSVWAKIVGRAVVVGFSIYGLIHWILK